MPLDQRKEHRRQRLIKLIKERYGGSQAKFAAMAGLPATLISRYFNAKKGIGEDVRDKIEAELGIDGWFDNGFDGLVTGGDIPEISSLIASFSQLEAADRARIVLKVRHLAEEALLNRQLTKRTIASGGAPPLAPKAKRSGAA